MPVNILFVQGFGTCCDEVGGDTYATIRLFFHGNPAYTIEFFAYDTHDAVADTEIRLRDRIDRMKPHILIGHSMGGYFAMNHIRSVERSMRHTSTYIGHIPSRYILLMPLLESTPLLDFAATLNLPEVVRRMIEIPSGFIFPAGNSHDRGNILNTSFHPICFRQPLEIHPHLPTPRDLTAIFNSNTADVRIVYSTDEAVTSVAPEILACIPKEKIEYTYGKHSAFQSTKTDFFVVLERLLVGGAVSDIG
jgi:hypothetical protein